MQVDFHVPDSAFRLPVSIVVAYQRHKEVRRHFFNRFVYPSLMGSGAAEVIVVDGEEGAAAKRNAGAAKATQEFLVLWDDDCMMAADYTTAMIAALTSAHPNVAFAYCDALEIVHPDAPKHPTAAVKVRKSKPWNAGELQRGNYVSNMSMIRRVDFPGCDERLKRLVDWDMWLTLADRGKSGVYIPEVLYHAYYLDHGITAGAGGTYEAAAKLVREKHRK